jgi:hypothetical protein
VPPFELQPASTANNTTQINLLIVNFITLLPGQDPLITINNG